MRHQPLVQLQEGHEWPEPDDGQIKLATALPDTLLLSGCDPRPIETGIISIRAFLPGRSHIVRREDLVYQQMQSGNVLAS